MRNSRFWFIVISAILSALLVQACQKAMAIEYTKYENDAAVPRISVEDSKKEVDAGNAVVIDARPEGSYKAEHIAGSINLPFGSDEQYAKLPAGKKLIFYCSCPAEHTSAAMAFQMNQKGAAGVYAMVGGTNTWKSAGYPMEKSE
jgi:rhodanese-related sulfurtransferase